MLKSIFLVSFWFFMTLVALCCAYNPNGDHLEERGKVPLRIKVEDGKELLIPLVKTYSFLANENLPVWNVRGDAPDKLIRDNEVVKQIGQYIAYQDSASSSAAIYFHNLQKMYGIIDVRFIINGMPIMDISEVSVVDAKRTLGVISRHPDLHGHRSSRSPKGNDLLMKHLSESIGTQLANETHSAIRSRRNLPNVVYVQALIIVNYDVLLAIRREFGEDIGIGHYLVILFNNVDMLYSKVNEPNIKINIAGVIIGTERESLSVLKNCYRKRYDGNIIREYMETRCIHAGVQSFLEQTSDTISPDSHNVAIFLTSFNLRFKLLLIDQSLHGMTSDETVSVYQIKQSGLPITPIVSAYHIEYFGNFHTIAHEMAHALRVHAHDRKPYTDASGNCCAYLMREDEGNCKNCLSWSSATRQSFREYFSSPDRCFFIKKPRSLEKPGPTVIWSKDELCQCFGYDYGSVETPQRSFLDKICQVPVKDQCEMNMICKYKSGKSHIAPLPLDGTPCGMDFLGMSKVCWNKKCKSVQEQGGTQSTRAMFSDVLLRVRDLESLLHQYPQNSRIPTARLT